MNRSATFVLMFALAVLAGCDSDAPAQPTAVPMTYERLMAALRTAGATVEEQTLDTTQPFFDERGRLLLVNGERVIVFTFPDAAAAITAGARISRDGGTATLAGRAVHVDWIAPPHFYRKDTLIVQYIGDRADITDLLARLLGPQFAGR